MSGKYEGAYEARNEALHLLCANEWANESDGDVEAPTGYFWRITIEQRELAEVLGVLEGFDVPNLDPDELVGEFIVREDSQGFVHVADYSTDEPVRAFGDRSRVAFRSLQRKYADWEDVDH